jgi:hypothetical protein
MFKGLSNLFRKGKKMPEQTAAATPPNSGGIDAKALADAISAGIAEQLKPLAAKLDQLTSPAPAPAAAAAVAPAATAAAAAEKPLTLADIAKALNDRDQANAQRAALATSKQTFLDSKMKDLPGAYRAKLGDDPSKWTAEEQAIRSEFRADFKIAGGQATQVGGDVSDGSSPETAVDTSKMTAIQKIELGLRLSKPSRGTWPQALAATAPANGAAAAN